jgi:tight adherence protein B
MTRRMDSRDWEIIATAIEIQRASGGNLAEILSGVAATIRDRQSLKREVRALTSSERYAAIIIAGFPFVLAGVLSLMLWETYGRLLYDPIGRMILAGAIVMDLIGYAVIQRVTKIEV